MIFGSGGLLVVMMGMVIGDSDADSGLCDKHGDDDVTCGVGLLYWQEVWTVEEQRDEGVVMRGHTLPKNKTSIRDKCCLRYICLYIVYIAHGDKHLASLS